MGLRSKQHARKCFSTMAMAVVAWTMGSASAADAESLVQNQFQTSVCNVETMTVEFSIDVSNDEPVVRSKASWLAGPNTAPDCLSKRTDIYVSAETPEGSLVFVKLNTRLGDAGAAFGPTSSTSPDWAALMCDSADESARCLPGAEAREVLSGLAFKGFEVVADATVVSLKPAAVRKDSGSSSTDGAHLSAFDALLDEPEEEVPETPTEAPAPVTVEPVVVVEPEPVDPQKVAEDAAKQISALLSSSLAQYATPSRKCESARRISNWVRIVSTCQMNLRRESTHDYTCAEGGEQREVVSTDKADLDFSRHIDSVGALRHLDDGPVTLVLRLNEDVVSIGDSYEVDRWQFVGATHLTSEMEVLAESLTSLRAYCEGKS